MSDKRNTSIRVPVLARVEGEGALDLEIRNGEISDLKLRIFEPPRLFEKFLQGRAYHEVPDFVARICGICPVAYQMSAVHAIEQIFHCDPGPWVRDMRRLLYCGEWLESHALHVHLLALPDFFGFNSVAEMAKQYPEEVRRGLALQAIGNEIVRLLGGRSVHPIGVRVGGFYRAPSRDQVTVLLKKVRQEKIEAENLLQWISKMEMPSFEQPFISVAVQHHNEYPMNQGVIVSSAEHRLELSQYREHFVDHQAAYSTAFHTHLNGKPYLVGPLARLNLNLDRMPALIQSLVHSLPVSFPSQNMFHSLIARAIEIYYALDLAEQILVNYEMPEASFVEPEVQAGVGYGCTEAPRGMLWHRYELDERGLVVNADIVPPTSQNQARIEEDIYNSLNNFGLENDDDALRLRAEMVIRNYDPCISCSTHFIDLRVTRH